MSTRRRDDSDQDSQNETIYLSKVLLFTENAHSLAEQLRDLSESTVNTNCLNTIGMYPLISRITTDLGTLCMSIWIISLDSRFEQFRMAYYSGSSHSIILHNSNDDCSLTDLINITPRGIPTTFLTISSNSNEEQIVDLTLPNGFITDNDQRSISIRTINDINEITTIFEEIGQLIAQELISGEYQTFTPQMVKPSNIYKLYNKRSFEKVQEIINRLGYELNNEGIVILPKNLFTFEIDFYRNQVKANISNCLTCKKQCKHYRKLCVVEEDQGFSNSLHFDNLRALAILYAIHDNEFVSLAGGKASEDIFQQLRRLREIYEVNCPFCIEEQQFRAQKKSKQKRKHT
ncbi:MAG: hypothetical protein FK731_00815 [Asgard group archaeon]|nr:hypothetical protein [Asgard group archaeon]